MDEIGATDLDYIEAYNPGMSPPMPVAFAKFKNKAIWISWSSAWHNKITENAELLTRKLLAEASAGGRFLWL